MILPLNFPKFFIYDIFFNGTEYVIITSKITSQTISLQHSTKILFNYISPKSLNCYIKKKSNKFRNKHPQLLYSCSHEIYTLNINDHNIAFTPYIHLIINQQSNNISHLITPVNIYPNYTNKIIMSTLVLNENNYIIPWIEYYRMLGVNAFIIYDNKNDNNNENKNEKSLETLLSPYIKLNIVTLIKWDYTYTNQAQDTQQNHSIWAFRSSSYIGLFDVDEYLNLQDINNSLHDFFSLYLSVFPNQIDNIGCFKFYSKNFVNINNQSEKHLDFLSIYNCGPIITNGRAKSFVIPRNVSLYSIHIIVIGMPTITLNIYFNHYIFLNKYNRGRTKIPHMHTDNSIYPLHKKLIDRWFS